MHGGRGGGRVIALTKKMPERYDYAGEGVGFLRVRHADTPHVVSSLRGYIDRGSWDMEYEDALRQYFQDVQGRAMNGSGGCPGLRSISSKT